jgi:uncharacterized protein (DUF302 family)
MLEARSEQGLNLIEAALRRAAERRGVSLLGVQSAAQVLRDKGAPVSREVLVYSLCQAELFAALLEADVRAAALLPCRVAAYEEDGRAVLQTLPPTEFGRLLNRPDLIPLTAPMETLLREILEEAACPLPAAAQASAALHRGGLGATEEQVSLRAALPQRIDCRGTKIEELAGTGQHDAPGG